jgi:hypothetical protein
MNPRSTSRWWRLTAFLGLTLIAVGVFAFYLDVAVHFRYEFIEDHYDAFGTSILIGVVFAFIGCIGWARLCGKHRRSLIAGLVFIGPWAALLIGSPIGGMNIHGPAAIAMMLTIPSTVLAVILLIMAALSSGKPR